MRDDWTAAHNSTDSLLNPDRLILLTIFGVSWSELEFEHVEHFLADGGSEGLSWEVKGTRIAADEVRIQVCGFANSHDGGYLILGASRSDDRWVLDGFPCSDPPAWIADVVGDGGVSPFPDGLDTKDWRVGADRRVAVVKIPPAAAPPCNSRGRVYERVSGKTISVTEPLRLAALFERGDSARRSAGIHAGRIAEYALNRGRGRLAPNTNTQFGFGLASAGYLDNIPPRLFSQSFEQSVVSSMQTVLRHDPLTPDYRPPIVTGVGQDFRSFESQPTDQLGWVWGAWFTAVGAAGMYWTQRDRQPGIGVEYACGDPLRQAWQCLDEILTLLRPQGPRFIQLNMVTPTGETDPRSVLPAKVVTRGPLSDRVDPTVLASVERELRRAMGEMAYEAP
jgi:hypothetical protein